MSEVQDAITNPASGQGTLHSEMNGDPTRIPEPSQGEPRNEVPPKLNLDDLKARQARLTKTVLIESLGMTVVVKKLPAELLETSDIDEMTPMVLALKYGLKEPAMTDELLAELTFEEVSEIFDEIEKFNPGVITARPEGEDDPAAELRKSFPS